MRQAAGIEPAKCVFAKSRDGALAGQFAARAGKGCAERLLGRVFMAHISTFMASGRLALELRVALSFNSSASSLPPDLATLPLARHMNYVRDDKLEQSLIVGDHDHRAVRGSQPVDAFGDDLESVDVEARISFIEHASRG